MSLGNARPPEMAEDRRPVDPVPCGQLFDGDSLLERCYQGGDLVVAEPTLDRQRFDTGIGWVDWRPVRAAPQHRPKWCEVEQRGIYLGVWLRQPMNGRLVQRQAKTTNPAGIRTAGTREGTRKVGRMDVRLSTSTLSTSW